MAAPGQIIRATLSYSHPNGSIGQNVFYWKVTTATIPNAEIIDIIEDWVTNEWGNNWNSMSTVFATLDDVSIDIVNLDGTVSVDLGAVVIALAGAVGGQLASAAVSAFMLATTDNPRVVGRKFLPFLAENILDDGVLNAAGLVAAAAAFVDYLDALPSSGSGFLEPGVISRIAEVWNAFNGGGYYTDVPAYQRRRKPNVGS